MGRLISDHMLVVFFIYGLAFFLPVCSWTKSQTLFNSEVKLASWITVVLEKSKSLEKRVWGK